MPRRRRRSKVRDRLTDGVNLLCACGKSLATYHVTVNGDPDGWPATRARWNRADFPADIRHADKWQVKCPLCGPRPSRQRRGPREVDQRSFGHRSEGRISRPALNSGALLTSRAYSTRGRPVGDRSDINDWTQLAAVVLVDHPSGCVAHEVFEPMVGDAFFGEQ